MPLWRGGAAPVHRPAGSSEAGARGQQIGAAEEVERPEAATRERGIGYVAIKDVVDDQLQPETVVDIEADGPVDQRIGADVIDRSILDRLVEAELGLVAPENLDVQIDIADRRADPALNAPFRRSEEHTSELQS